MNSQDDIRIRSLWRQQTEERTGGFWDRKIVKRTGPIYEIDAKDCRRVDLILWDKNEVPNPIPKMTVSPIDLLGNFVLYLSANWRDDFGW